MTSRLNPLFPLVFLLALSIVGCSRHQDEPTPVLAASTGSYKLDGKLVTCPQITVFEYPNRSGLGADELQVQLIVPATAQIPGDNMLLSFVKTTGSPVSDYDFRGATHIIFPSGNTSLQTRSYNANHQFTLSATANGAYSGTFSCRSPGLSPVDDSQITEGVFANAHP
ncbi:MAG: hypothetical protein M3Y12_02650 [Bacteroidota bacterium]|nr:hypothetical protein [Bacteroidota bacterium]